MPVVPQSEIDEATKDQVGGTTPTVADGNPSPLPRIPGYDIEKQLGSGGMGVVYKAIRRDGGRSVALKVIRAQEMATPNDLKRFVIEAEVLAKLQHPNIVKLIDAGVSEVGPYYAMELLGDANLADRLSAAPMPFRDGAQLLATVARTVESAHGQGIVHRDLKPANILLMEDGTPKLVDFGIAKILASNAGLTVAGKPIGTPGYMSPEQAAGTLDIGPGTDVYALGVILYQFLTGRVPFAGDDLYDVFRAIIADEPVSPAWYRTDAPRDLETICMKCLRKKSAERYPSASAMADDLDRYLNHEPLASGHTPPWRRFAKWCRRKVAAK